MRSHLRLKNSRPTGPKIRAHISSLGKHTVPSRLTRESVYLPDESGGFTALSRSLNTIGPQVTGNKLCVLPLTA